MNNASHTLSLALASDGVDMWRGERRSYYQSHGRFIWVCLLAGAFWMDGLAEAAAPASIRSEDPSDYVQVRDSKFVLVGKPFVIRGTNYFGSWRFQHTIETGNGVEQDTPWEFYRDWDIRKLDMDFQFMRSQLRATVVRIGTPAIIDFGSLVQYHGYPPWYGPDGAISEQYKNQLTELADIAYSNGMRIQFCLLWNVGNEIAKNPGAFAPGAQMDKFYSNQVRSIGTALRNRPGVIGYSIGNEVLVKWPINGTHSSPYESQAEGFIVRRLRELRDTAPRQLLTTDEVAHPQAKQWYAPGPEFAHLPEVDTGSGNRAQSMRLADVVDYIGTHFYPETLRSEDLHDGFVTKLSDAKEQLAIYMQAANDVRKPVSMNEFGLKITPETLAPEQYAAARDRFFQALIAEGQRLGLQGLLVWGAIPEVALRPGQYVVKESKLNQYSPVEVDIDKPGKPLRRVLFYFPEWALFDWQGYNDLPTATPAAHAVESAWADIPQPIVTSAHSPTP
jgi:hypothetical protein